MRFASWRRRVNCSREVDAAVSLNSASVRVSPALSEQFLELVGRQPLLQGAQQDHGEDSGRVHRFTRLWRRLAGLLLRWALVLFFSPGQSPRFFPCA